MADQKGRALTAHQRHALAILNVPLSQEIGYWWWRSQIRPFRLTTRKRLEDAGLIVIHDGLVRITDEGRSALETWA